MTGHRGEASIVSFNLQAGVDRWARPFDVVATCKGFDADVLVLQEDWAAPGRSGLAETVATELGYALLARPMAQGRRAEPHPHPHERWMPWYALKGPSRVFYLDSERPLPARVTRTRRFESASPGTWGMAVLSRIPVVDTQVVDLGVLPRDRARRFALVVRLGLAGRSLTVVGTHMSHLSKGSPAQLMALRRLLPTVVGDEAAVLAADMNLWGPPVGAFFPGWRRIVRGRTWPADAPHSQVDHLLARGPVTALSSRVLPETPSDHRPVWARLRLD